jgi:SAM-dependent methyltransferase
MRDYYEDLWGRLPEDLDPPDLDLRLTHLRAGVRAGDRVLDLGCGDGRFTQEIARLGATPIGVDVAQAALDRARAAYPDIDFKLAPIDGPLPLHDVSLDVVWTSEVIEHVADTARWLSEVRRVLVPRGRLLLTTPSHGRLRVAFNGIEAFSDPLGDHLHLYTRPSLRTLLADFGFDEISVRTSGGPPFFRRLLLARAVR